MNDPRTEPVDLELSDSKRTLIVRWADGHETRVAYRGLRQSCPCAVCVDELTGERVLDPDSVPLTIGIAECEQVGLYGLRIYWTDEHRTGIFTWDRLRSMG